MTTRVPLVRTAARSLSQSGAGTGGAGQTVVGLDPLGVDAEFGESVDPGGEILSVGGAAGVSDQEFRHDQECSV